MAMDDTPSTRTKGSSTGKKGINYHKNYKRLWPFAVTTSSRVLEPPLVETTAGTHHSREKPPTVVSDATIITTATIEQQQMEMGESSCCGSSCTRAVMLHSPLDGESMISVVTSTTTSCNSSSSGTGSSMTSSTSGSSHMNGMTHTARIATQVDANNNKRMTKLQVVFACLPCNDMIQAIVSRSFYSLASISMILMNKSIDKSYHHYVEGDLSILIIIFQSTIVLGCIESCRQWKRNGSNSNSNQKVRVYNTLPVSLHYTVASLFTGIFFIAMLVTSMIALHCNSLSMIIVSRNVANLILMVGDYVAFRKPPDVYVATIYNVLLAGAIFAALKQRTFVVTWIGLAWMVANCVSTAGYILCMKHFITTEFLSSLSNGNCSSSSIPLTQHHLSSPPTSGATNKIAGTIYSIIFIHNTLCIVMLLPAAYMMGEISLFVESTAIHTTEYASKTIAAGILCFIFNYALLNCVEQQSQCTKQHHTSTSINPLPHSQQNHRRPSISERRSRKLLT